MSKRLQVVLDDAELREIRKTAKASGLTVSAWVRQSLRQARDGIVVEDPDKRLAVVRAAARNAYPTADIDDMLGQIESGYAGSPS